jgi:hypothetical protein
MPRHSPEKKKQWLVLFIFSLRKRRRGRGWFNGENQNWTGAFWDNFFGKGMMEKLSKASFRW